ncbi:hypothetical protein JCM10213v2_001212 [Rhodosporidiobolus nylandii]
MELSQPYAIYSSSCQVSISYDFMETQVVLASYIGGCPLSLPYTFTVPDIPGADKACFIWSWFNYSGNREMYQNAAVVAVSGTADSFTGPNIFRANTFGDGVCNTPEGTDFVFPNPGEQVIYGGKYSSDSPPSAGSVSGCGDWDNEGTVTVKGSGSGPDATDASGGASGGGSSGGGGSGESASETVGDGEGTGAAGGTATGSSAGGEGTGTANSATAAGTTATGAAGASKTNTAPY